MGAQERREAGRRGGECKWMGGGREVGGGKQVRLSRPREDNPVRAEVHRRHGGCDLTHSPVGYFLLGWGWG